MKFMFNYFDKTFYLKGKHIVDSNGDRLNLVSIVREVSTLFSLKLSDSKEIITKWLLYNGWDNSKIETLFDKKDVTLISGHNSFNFDALDVKIEHQKLQMIKFGNHTVPGRQSSPSFELRFESEDVPKECLYKLTSPSIEKFGVTISDYSSFYIKLFSGCFVSEVRCDPSNKSYDNYDSEMAKMIYTVTIKADVLTVL